MPMKKFKRGNSSSSLQKVLPVLELQPKPNPSLIPLLGPMPVSYRSLKPGPNLFIPLVQSKHLKTLRRARILQILHELP